MVTYRDELFREYSDMPENELREIMMQNACYVNKRKRVVGEILHWTKAGLAGFVGSSLTARLLGNDELSSQINHLTLDLLIVGGLVSGIAFFAYLFSDNHYGEVRYRTAKRILKTMHSKK